MIKNKNLFIILILVSFSTMYYRFALSAQIEQINKLDNEIKVKKQLLSENPINSQKIIQNTILIYLNNFKIIKLYKKIPFYIDIEQDINSIMKLAKNNNIQFKNIQIETQVPITIDEQTTVYEKSIKLSIIGTYNDLNLFINKINTLNPLHIIKNISISINEKYIQADFYISVYSIEGEH